jgi:peptidoglycan/xylan/chitin deacetylase (PgdA/CDA1 family)
VNVATLRALALGHAERLQPSQGYLSPLVGPLEWIVAAIALEPGLEAELAHDLPQGEARAEALAVRLRRAGERLIWGEPLTPGSAADSERFAYRRGRSSVEIARADPSLVCELQVGSWFNTGWRGRLLRRLLVRAPRLSTLVRLLAGQPAALNLSLDVWFWAGVRSRATSREWRRLTRSSYVALCYHQLSDQPRDLKPELTVSWRRFRRQVRILRLIGYEPMSLEDTVMFHQDPSAVLGGRRYLLTADDGYLDAVESLERCAASSPVSFIVTGFAAGRKTWDVQPDFADWSRVRAAGEAGVVLGSHTRSHPALVDCGDSALEDELSGARADFAAAGLAAPAIVAYPYGRHDHRVRAAAIDSPYLLAYTTQAGRNAAGTDPWCLRRITIEPWDGPLVFLWKLITGEALPTFVERRRRSAVGSASSP